jgi:hypothetical protein
MIWRFTILNNRTSVATVVDEPTGWDANTSEIKRDLDWHGIFFTSQGDTFQFDGEAMRLIKYEYETYGVQADMTLIMEEDCGNGFEEFSRGKFMFKNYEFVCGIEYYVKVPIETTTEVKDLRNRINQKVDLEAVKSFDETTTLPTYSKLPFEMELPSKGIFIQNKAINNTIIESPILGISTGNTQSWEFGHIDFAFSDITSSEIGGFSVEDRINYTAYGGTNGPTQTSPHIYFVIGAAAVGGYPDLISPILNYGPEFPNYGAVSEPLDIDINIGGTIILTNCNVEEITACIISRKRDDTYSLIDYSLIFFTAGASSIPNGSQYDFNYSYQNTAYNIEKDERLYLMFTLGHNKSVSQIQNGLDAFTIKFNVGNYLNIKTLSHTPATTSKVFAINETISRIAESVTNNKVKAYSEYFGRTDSQPYSQSVDGIGSLEVITNGLRIRKQENKIAGETNKFSISLQDIWEGLNPIHNLGMGLEADNNRPGYNRLRVEDWKYFYSDVPLLTCDNVDKITRKSYEREIFSTFQFGYAKWEAEEYTGLDEFLTKRTYRTTINAIKNDLVKLSKFIGSGYALEITRRKGDNSKDWRYDKETFIVCCQRNNSGDFIVELGNISTPQNIIDPNTIYNFRISPVRNAMRWMNKVLESYRQYDSNSKIIFTDGDANYFAKGEMISTVGKLESASISENQTILPSLFIDIANAKPFMTAERVVFDYPMTSREYKQLLQNPYGTIYFSTCSSHDSSDAIAAEDNDILTSEFDEALIPENIENNNTNACEEGFGWIDTIIYKPEQGFATFTLIPKAM